MSVVLHISDTHFGTERDFAQRALSALVGELQPELLIVSGDITQRATAAQFAAARRWLDQLAVPHCLLLPGNHDIPLFALWQRLFSPYRRFRRGLRVDALAPQHIRDDLHVVSVKTTRRRRHIDGEVSARQIDAIREDLLQADPAALKIVVTHQPLWVDRERDQHNRCHGADPALRAWCEAGADLFLSGHIHWPFVIELPHRRGSWVANAGTATSWRIRDGAPNSCNVLRYQADTRRCEVERWDCLATDPVFRRAAQHSLSLRGRSG